MSSPPFYDFMNVGGSSSSSSSSSSRALEFKKHLTSTDTSFLGYCNIARDAMTQLVLPYWDAARRQAYENNEKVDVCIWDCDTQSEHHLKVKKHSNICKLYVGWSQQFVQRRNLKEGDEISLCWNVSHQRFDFRVLQRATLPS